MRTPIERVKATITRRRRERQFDRAISTRVSVSADSPNGSPAAPGASTRASTGFGTVSIVFTDGGGAVVCDPRGVIDIRAGEGVLDALQRLLTERNVPETARRPPRPRTVSPHADRHRILPARALSYRESLGVGLACALAVGAFTVWCNKSFRHRRRKGVSL